MPKRKRDSDLSLEEELEKHCHNIFRALKLVKGHERQRQGKWLHDNSITPAKRERLEREVVVLKSIDLHQTARAHLYASLLKVKSIAASTDLPDEIRTGLPKPELSQEEKTALHNVTSSLYNRDPVKQATQRAIEDVCQTLNIPNPDKAKSSKKSKKGDVEESRSRPTPSVSVEEKLTQETNEVEEDEVTDFEGFESDVDEPGPAVGEEQESEETDAIEEKSMSQYDGLLGSSSDEEGDEDFSGDAYARFRGKEKVNLDDISLSGSGSEVGDDDEENESMVSDTETSEASASPSPPPESTKQKEKRKKAKAAAIGPTTNSTFLPSLMGGYISGSESASDVDIAPPKKRRGQRARQAIWEQKYGAKAKHLQKPSRGGGRDAGWDMRKGAVDGTDRGRRGPWKQGVSNPLRDRTGGENTGQPVKQPAPAKRDDEGKLHPSWEARKKAKESQKETKFAGKKITFD